MSEQPALALKHITADLSAVPPDAGHADNTVTRHNDRDGILATGVADGTRTAVKAVRQFPVGPGLARGDLQQRPPDPLLESRAREGHRYAKLLSGVGEITLEFTRHPFAGSRTCQFQDHAFRQEINPHNTIPGHSHTDRSQRGIQDQVKSGIYRAHQYFRVY